MSVEVKAPNTNKDDLIMRSVHGDEVRMPFTFFQRLRKYHASWANKSQLDKPSNATED